jgi:hypothetical protein
MEKIVSLAVALSFITGAAYAYDDGDFQFWNTEAEEFAINEEAKIAIEEEFRWGDDAKDFYYQHYDLGYTQSLKKWFALGGGYRHVLSLQKNKWLVENEPYIAGTLFWDLGGCKLDSRSRWEYRHFDYQSDMGRYRNKFTLKFPWKFTPLQLSLFLSDETLFRLGGTNQFAENRASAGWLLGLGKNIKAEAYYLLDSTKNSKGKWIDSHILGMKLKIAF